MTVEINANQVKDLREKTGVGFMECKKALQEAQGDPEKAIKILRERGVAKAEKRSGRAAAEGLIGLKISPDGRKATMVELNCETDFVARNDQFRAFLNAVVDFTETLPVATLAAAGPGGGVPGETVLDKTFDAATRHTLKDALVEQIAKTGENLVFRRFARFEAPDGFLTGYIHPPGKIGVVVELGVDGGAAGVDPQTLLALGKDVAMHVAASAPRYLDRSAVDAKHLEAEKDIYANKARNEGKPEKILPKIVEGMVQKFYKDVCLIEQPFVKDPNISVGQLAQQLSKQLGKAVTVKRFVRFQVGEELAPIA
jgi:elongation factor Ts